MKNLAIKIGLEKTGVAGKCLSEQYINDKTELEWQCGKCGYTWKAKPNKVKRGTWCGKCAQNIKLTIEDMYELAKNVGIKRTGVSGKCLSKQYINNRTPLEWQCGKCNHRWKTIPTCIKRNSWCPNCSKSNMENGCRKAFEKIFNAKFPTVRPEWLINPKTEHKMHLDGYNEDLKIAFEYNGKQHYLYYTYFHKDFKEFLDQQDRDRIKKQLCEDQGIILIIVPYTVKIDKMQDYIIKEYNKQIKKFN